MKEALIIPPRAKARLALEAEEVDIFKGQTVESIDKIVKETPVKELLTKILLKFNSM